MMRMPRESSKERTQRLEQLCDSLNLEIAALREREEVLERELERAIGTGAEYMELAKRARADYENLQRRVDKTVGEMERYGRPGDLIELIRIHEELDLACAGAGADPRVPESILKGLVMVKNNFGAFLSGKGVVEIETDGRPFDPNYHDAMATIRTDGMEAGTIMKTIKKGYAVHDRVLIPASVIVSGEPETEDEDAEDDTKEEME